MKIAILSPAHPFRGGIAASTERLAREFQNSGHEVQLINFTRQYPGFLFPGKTQMTDSPPPDKLKIIRKIHSYNPFNWIRTGLWLKKMDIDMIIVRYWIPFMAPALGTIAWIASKKRKTIGFVDNIIPHEEHFYDRFFSKYFVSKMHDFVVMSKSVQKEMQSFVKKQRILYAPHPIYDIYGNKIEKNEARKILGLDPKTRYILFFGFIRDYKGLDFLLKAMAEKEFVEKDMKLIIAGEFYGNREKYESLIDDLNIREQVIIKSDYIPDDAVKNYFCAADLLVQTYKTATQSGIAQIAYHFELPMIVTNVGGLAEIVIDGKSGYVVEKDIGAISGAIAKYFDEQKESEFSEGTRELKKQFSWKNLSDCFIQLYNS